MIQFKLDPSELPPPELANVARSLRDFVAEGKIWSSDEWRQSVIGLLDEYHLLDYDEVET